MRRGVFCFGATVVIAYAQLAFSQTTTNPDLSVIPRFRLESDNAKNSGDELKFGSPRFDLEETEIAIQGYLNPFARADIFLTKPGGGSEPIEIEEAYATFVRGLPGDLNVRIGKFKAEFGKLNPQHPHAWPFLTMPLVLDRFLGDGANDLGISASLILPTGDFYSRLNVDFLKGTTVQQIDPMSGDVAGGMGLKDLSNSKTYSAVAARAMCFVPVQESSDLELGLSGMNGIHDPYNKYRFTYANLDFKYKWKPDAYTSLTVQGEALMNWRTIAVGNPLAPTGSADMQSSGFYVYGDYQFQKIFTIGARYDRAQAPYSKDDGAYAFSIFAGYYPVEVSTALRLQLQRTSTDAGGVTTNVNMIAVQFMFSLGPHKAHPF
ncbi:MAG: hypothetical protein HY966_05875 [Ignavibacteriales bacterium]|nr:hypothetical protein [Ignavibacteriales bacterium]